MVTVQSLPKGGTDCTVTMITGPEIAVAYA